MHQWVCAKLSYIQHATSSFFTQIHIYSISVLKMGNDDVIYSYQLHNPRPKPFIYIYPKHENCPQETQRQCLEANHRMAWHDQNTRGGDRCLKWLQMMSGPPVLELIIVILETGEADLQILMCSLYFVYYWVLFLNWCSLKRVVVIFCWMY